MVESTIGGYYLTSKEILKDIGTYKSKKRRLRILKVANESEGFSQKKKILSFK